MEQSMRQRRGSRVEWLAWGLLIFLALGLSPVVAQEEIPTVTFVVERFVVAGDNPLSPEESNAVLAPFTGEHGGPEGILAAADALGAAIQRAGFSFRRVVFPPQTLTEGVIRLEVVGFKLARLEVRGNRFYSAENILASLPALVVGEVPSTRRLARSLNLANDHPGKQVTVTFRESEEQNALDARVGVEDQKSWQVFSAFNNTGSDETGETRIAFGVQHANIFNRDHQGTVSYTTSPGHTGDVQQWGLSYVAPLYRYAGSLSLLYVTSSVDTGDAGLGGDFNVTGSGDFAGLRYTQYLPRFRSLDHRVFAGIDDRLFETTSTSASLGFNDESPVRSRPLSVGYAGTYRAPSWTADFEIQYVRNLEAGGANNGTAYRKNRGAVVGTSIVGASPRWDLLRARANLVLPFENRWALQARIEGQLASEPLIPGEQFGLGGAGSVRGFAEREIAGDDGVFASAELWSPPLPVNLRGLVYADAGFVRFSKPVPVPGQDRDDTVFALGGGLRWSYKQNLSASFDTGYVLSGFDNRAAGGSRRETGSVRVHFSILARY